MSLYTRRNLYAGINAHLHSYFQAEGGWSSFHTNFIASLARYLNAILPDGFIVDVEQSLQIREIHPDTGERLRHPEPDLTIYQTSATRPPRTGDNPTTAPVVQAIPATFDLSEELYYAAVVIYRSEPDAVLGRAVTRIELLSPTNKLGEGYIQYREKRFAALKSGVALVEVDFLHETPPIIKGLPSYPYQANSYPYHIIVSDPTPDFANGHTLTYSFAVDEAIPIIPTPLGEDSNLDVDMGAVYTDVYTSLSAYSRRVDYAVLPLHFDRYSKEDQIHIQAVMQRAIF